MFIDNDDYIDNDYVEQYVNVAESGKYDLVIGGHRRTSEKKEILSKTRLPDTIWGKYITLTPWARIYRREYIVENDIKFLTCNIGEDIYFNMQALIISNNIKIIDYIGYNWVFNTKSVSNTIQKNFYDVDKYRMLDETYKVLQQKNLLLKEREYVELFLFLFIIWLFIYTGKSLSYRQMKLEYNKLFGWLEERYPNYKKNKLVGLTKLEGEKLFNRIKLTIFMFLHKCKLGVVALFIYTRIWEKFNG